MKRFLLILFLAWLPFVRAAGQDTSAQKGRKAKLEKEIELIEQQLKENGVKNTNALNTLALVRKKVSVREAIVKENENEIRALTDTIDARQSRVDALQARLDTLSLYYTRLIRNAYRNRDARIWYMYILSSSSIGQASRRYGYLRTLSSQMNTQARKIGETRTELEAGLKELMAYETGKKDGAKQFAEWLCGNYSRIRQDSIGFEMFQNIYWKSIDDVLAEYEKEQRNEQQD